jgi:hypothetical protein
MNELSYAERARASNKAAAEKHAAEKLHRLIEAGSTAEVYRLQREGAATEADYMETYRRHALKETAALCAPLSNKGRCDAIPFRGTFPLKGNFNVSLRVAFFDRTGQLIEENHSNRCVYADDELPAEITPPAGACFLRMKVMRDERYGGDVTQRWKI